MTTKVPWFDNLLTILWTFSWLDRGSKTCSEFFFNLIERESIFSYINRNCLIFLTFINTSDGGSLVYYQLTLDKDSRNQSRLQYVEAREKEYVVNLGRYEASYPWKYIEYVKLGVDGHLRTYWHNVDIHFVDVFTQECLYSQNGYRVKEVRNYTFSDISNASVAIIS